MTSTFTIEKANLVSVNILHFVDLPGPVFREGEEPAPVDRCVWISGYIIRLSTALGWNNSLRLITYHRNVSHEASSTRSNRVTAEPIKRRGRRHPTDTTETILGRRSLMVDFSLGMRQNIFGGAIIISEIPIPDDAACDERRKRQLVLPNSKCAEDLPGEPHPFMIEPVIDLMYPKFRRPVDLDGSGDQPTYIFNEVAVVA